MPDYNPGGFGNLTMQGALGTGYGTAYDAREAQRIRERFGQQVAAAMGQTDPRTGKAFEAPDQPVTYRELLKANQYMQGSPQPQAAAGQSGGPGGAPQGRIAGTSAGLPADSTTNRPVDVSNVGGAPSFSVGGQALKQPWLNQLSSGYGTPAYAKSLGVTPTQYEAGLMNTGVTAGASAAPTGAEIAKAQGMAGGIGPGKVTGSQIGSAIGSGISQAGNIIASTKYGGQVTPTYQDTGIRFSAPNIADILNQINLRRQQEAGGLFG
jgi:hypothetical protein